MTVLLHKSGVSWDFEGVLQRPAWKARQITVPTGADSRSHQSPGSVALVAARGASSGGAGTFL
ncbi:hypothetical protein EAO76_41660 [Streptomyces sp. sk2.1]|nr:hypothetical protein EAO76_41660 [Streptomyces sp. sk2.1]